MAATSIAQIDDLFSGRGAATPLSAINATADAVGVIQDCLIGHGYKGIPGILGTARGTFGPRTSASLSDFQRTHGLADSGSVDAATLRAFVQSDWVVPFACAAYVALVLDLDCGGVTRLVSLTSQFEGAGRFAAINRNTDHAGLSFGLIQWAQKPGRLHELLLAFRARQPALFVDVFGGGDRAVADGLIEHTAKPSGGVDANGNTTDPRFDLVGDVWVQRFTDAGRRKELQRVQIDVASADFGKSLAKLHAFAPAIRSERGIAFMLDLANQHGDAGAQDILRKVTQPGITEKALLQAIEEESVSRVRRQFGEGDNVVSTRNRRQAFRTSPLFSDAAAVI